uniref:Uncharacterized protein n=1 Tax=Ananas comosus var. bracteatus TaxID=296719 RepID=A0A6V7QZF2_ANACO
MRKGGIVGLLFLSRKMRDEYAEANAIVAQALDGRQDGVFVHMQSEGSSAAMWPFWRRLSGSASGKGLRRCWPSGLQGSRSPFGGFWPGIAAGWSCSTVRAADGSTRRGSPSSWVDCMYSFPFNF